MRTTFFAIAGVLLLASAMPASAQDQNATQQPPALQQATAPAAEQSWLGTIDLGFRGNDGTGDVARLERYRDVQNGAFSQLGFAKETPTFNFRASAYNIGRRDQRYVANYTGNRVRFTGGFDSIPLNYGYLTQTPWIETSPNVFALDTAERALVQAKSVVGVPQNAGDLSKVSIYRTISPTFDIGSLRQTGSFRVAFDVDPNTSFDAAYSVAHKSGNQPWGASFAFNVANELPIALDNNTHDASAGLEFTREQGMVRIGWNASWFDNNIKQLVWDNAYRLTDTTPYDASGYSNGNGPAQGRMSMAPSNTMNSVSAVALYKLPHHTTINGTASFAQMSQDDALIPWTINPVIANATVYKSFPGLASLPRDSAQAKVDAVNAMVNLTTRPNRIVSFNARYRYNDHANKTPVFDAVEYVRFDAVPEETGGETEPFNITENMLDASMTVQVARFTSVKLAYGYDGYDRTSRSFAKIADNAFRASVDTVGSQYLTVRAMYEHVKRAGSGFDLNYLITGGAQPATRFYDEANRDRDRGTLLFTVNPVEVFDITFSLSAGKDNYNDANQQFGLLDNDNTSYNVGVNVYPKGIVNFGANYGRDHYAANQASRNSNPLAPTDQSWIDPNRNWTLANTENVNNFDAFVDVPKAFGNKTNVRVAYDYSDSDNGFVFGGPRVDALAAIGQFLPLPNVTNKWQRLSADVSYYFQKQVGIAIGYWYEKFDVNDFATIDLPGSTGTPRIDYLGEISTGYANRPYRGNTAFVRLLYRF